MHMYVYIYTYCSKIITGVGGLAVVALCPSSSRPSGPARPPFHLCIYLSLSLSLSLSLYIYIYIYIYRDLASLSPTIASEKPLDCLSKHIARGVRNSNQR